MKNFMNTLTIVQLIREKRKCLNGIILLLLITFFSSCKKNNEEPPNNNEMNATVVLSSGDIIKINAKGVKALMGRDFWTGSFYVDGTSETNAAVYLSTRPNVTVPGTYVVSCQYRPDASSQTTPIYTNSGVSNPGSITFTVLDDHSTEGHFTAVCAYAMDSVTVSGSFKGNY
jgi:hypothetical protein